MISISNDISLRPLCKEDLSALARQLQPQDRKELAACYGLPVLQGLELCVARSIETVCFLYQGQVCAVAGIEPLSLLGKQACVWSWTTHTVRKCPKAFIRVSRYVLQVFQQYYPVLYAACAQSYRQARQYLKHIGGKEENQYFYLADPTVLFCLYRF